MDSTDSSITFDKNGVCDHCTNYYKQILPIWNYGRGHEKKLEKLITKIKSSSKNSDFDCILGMSGGIDSSYLLYLATNCISIRCDLLF